VVYIARENVVHPSVRKKYEYLKSKLETIPKFKYSNSQSIFEFRNLEIMIYLEFRNWILGFAGFTLDIFVVFSYNTFITHAEGYMS